MPGGFVCSGSLKAQHGATHVKEMLAGTLPIKKLFTKEQRAFYKEHAPKGIDLDGLSVLGPITVFKLKWRPPELTQRKMVAEMWLYPDGAMIVELSTKCLPAEAFQVAAETKAYLSRARRRHCGRAADEDEDRAGVLQQGAPELVAQPDSLTGAFCAADS